MTKERKFWNLTTRRGIDGKRALTHTDSRHRNDGENLTKPESGGKFKKGSLFPRHVNSSQISKIEQYTQEQWNNYCNGRPNNVLSSQPASDAIRVTIQLKKFGVRKVGAFIREGQVATVFPEEATGSCHLLNRKGEKTKKTNR